MDPWRTRLFLDALDERIVPDATPVVTFADGHTSGAVVAGFDLGGSGNNAYVPTGDPGSISGFLNDPGMGNNAY